MTAPIPARHRPRLRDAALLSATILGAGLLSPAHAAQFGVVVNQVADPVLGSVPLPDNAPTMGVFSGVQNWSMNAITLGLLPSGKVASYGTPGGNPGTQDGRTFDIWDPSQGITGGHLILPGVTGVNSFCAAQAFRTDGSLFIAGGIFDSGNDKGSVLLNRTGTGISAIAAKLANDRYYSSMLTLPNGQQLIMGGSFPYQGGWEDPQGAIDKGLMTGMTPEIYDGNGWRSLFGAKSRDAFGPDNNRFWYPRAWVAPNGKVFGISSEKMWYLDPTGNGSVNVMNFKEAQRDALSAADAPNVGPTSAAVMYEAGKILQVGGNNYGSFTERLSSSRATVIDINGGTPVVTDTAVMNYGRAWANATVLPTGQVAVTGGSKFGNQDGANAVLQSEIWDPKTGRWSLGASGGAYRGYHSTAILMQNGALLIAGGGAPGPVANQNVEVFYPPYLFTTVNGRTALAPRPQIVSLSTAQAQHGQVMQVELTSSNGLSQVVLIGLGATTHSFDSGQRRVVLPFTQAGNAVTVQAPANANIAPPGYYQLVAIDQKGVPSPGVIVALGAGVAAPPQVAAPGVVAPTGSGQNGGGTGASAGETAINSSADLANVAGTTGMTIKAVHSGLCLSVQAGNSANAGQIAQQTCTGVREQLWKVQSGYGGSVLYNVANGKCLDMSLETTPANGTRTYQWDCKGTPNQAWSLKPQNGGYALSSISAPNMCVDIANVSTQPGGIVWNWSCNGAANQSFLFGSTGGSANLPAANGQWTPIGTAAARVSVGADGTLVTLNAGNNVPWRYVGDNNWTPLPGNFRDIAVLSANSMYAIGMDTNVYRYNGQSWTQVGTNAKSIAAADGTVLIANGNNDIWLKQSDDNTNNWRQLPGKALRVAVMNRNSLWHIGIDNWVYRGDQNGNWGRVGPDAGEIAASPDGSVLVTNVSNKKMWRKTGDNTVGNWTQIDPNFQANAITIPNAQRAIVIGLDRNIYRY